MTVQLIPVPCNCGYECKHKVHLPPDIYAEYKERIDCRKITVLSDSCGYTKLFRGFNEKFQAQDGVLVDTSGVDYIFNSY